MWWVDLIKIGFAFDFIHNSIQYLFLLNTIISGQNNCLIIDIRGTSNRHYQQNYSTPSTSQVNNNYKW